MEYNERYTKYVVLQNGNRQYSCDLSVDSIRQLGLYEDFGLSPKELA